MRCTNRRGRKAGKASTRGKHAEKIAEDLEFAGVEAVKIETAPTPELAPYKMSGKPFGKRAGNYSLTGQRITLKRALISAGIARDDEGKLLATVLRRWPGTAFKTH